MKDITPQVQERISLGKDGETVIVETERTWDYPNGQVVTRWYQVQLADGTRSKEYFNLANALKAWHKAFVTDKVVK